MFINTAFLIGYPSRNKWIDRCSHHPYKEQHRRPLRPPLFRLSKNSCGTYLSLEKSCLPMPITFSAPMLGIPSAIPVTPPFGRLPDSKATMLSPNVEASHPSGIFPSGGESTQANLFMVRETEMNKPLAIKGLGHLLQDLDPAQVVFDQVVVGREDSGNSILDAK